MHLCTPPLQLICTCICTSAQPHSAQPLHHIFTTSALVHLLCTCTCTSLHPTSGPSSSLHHLWILHHLCTTLSVICTCSAPVHLQLCTSSPLHLYTTALVHLCTSAPLHLCTSAPALCSLHISSAPLHNLSSGPPMDYLWRTISSAPSFDHCTTSVPALILCTTALEHLQLLCIPFAPLTSTPSLHLYLSTPCSCTTALVHGDLSTCAPQHLNHHCACAPLHLFCIHLAPALYHL